MNKLLACSFIFCVFLACSTSEKELFVNYSNPNIKYSGRIDSSKAKGVDLYWSGTSIKLNFEGQSVAALFKDETGDNYYNVIIDDSLFIFRPDTLKQYHELATGLSKGKHALEIFKRTEWDRGKSTFYGFQLNGNVKILPKSKAAKRKIEFYGNSISAGYAVEDFSGKDSPDSTYTNNYLSYVNLTARNFDAEYRCICKSGIGITISWFPMIMPEMYDRLIPTDSLSQWDFSLYTPNVVVINLFQNDSWLVNMPERDEFKTNFGDTPPTDEYIINAYQEFVANIRKKYPNASIICALGNMHATKEGSQWPGYIEKAVANLEDPKVYTHFMPFKETEGHPSIKEQEAMAESLTKFIDENIQW
ncbi:MULTISPECIES: SGNH/GDSL hydrolase family protein [Flavobacteriaceae]|uniref:SGNH/GDSL hydrolase family protein n=1 Tax=Flavobacteriaceae TaxID=49546 RepID=UPI001492F6B8|nr:MULTISPECIES: SGNH/GDSL hydrolase family protein [Allomuricauda]MDC6364901.1 SGNH/GDSL hydrolase family protein [Muricauda sp. AC10]